MARKPIPEINGFGEEVVIALGALVIRSTQHEAHQRNMMAAISGMNPAYAWALLYSTTSAKARADAIKGMIAVSQMADDYRERANDLVDQIRSLADRRNLAMHLEYSVHPWPTAKSPPVAVQTAQRSAAKKMITTHPVELGKLHQLLDDYTVTGDAIRTFNTDVAIERQYGRWPE